MGLRVGGGYNVLVSRKGLNLKQNDGTSLKSLVVSRQKSGKPLTIGVPTGSLQHAKLEVYLKAVEIDPDKDVQIANIPFPNHPRALEAGEVDLAMTLSAFSFQEMITTRNRADGMLVNRR